MKKIIFMLCVLLTMNSMSVFAYEEQNYLDMRSDLAKLVYECKGLGLNCEYVEKSLNIFDYNIGYLKADVENGASADVIAYRESTMQEIYNNAKSELEKIKSENKTEENVLNLKDGAYDIEGRRLLNDDKKPIFSIGVVNSAPQNVLSELSNIGFENVHVEWGPRYVISEDNAVDSWKANKENTESMGATQVDGKLHIFSDGNGVFSISQNILLKKGMEYTLKVNATGNVTGLTVLVGGLNEKLTPSENVFTFIADDYASELCIKSNGETNAYIDNIIVTAKNDSRNIVINGDFSGDSSEEYDVYFDKAQASKILKSLDLAQKNNMSVDLLLSPHYFPEFLRSGIEYENEGGLFNYIIDSDIAMSVLKTYIDAIMPYVIEYPSLTSICLSNEPEYNTALAEDIYKEDFINYLSNVHGSNLSSIHGDISQISMPQSVESTPLFYDWRNFNNEVFANWHKQLAIWVKVHTDQIPVHSKVMNEITPLRSYMQSGIDMELFDEFCDVLGNDSSTFIEQDPKTSFIRTMMWYDYLRSISDKPIYNSEEHITVDSSTDFDAQMKDHFRSVIWQGAIHGRNMSSIWTWNDARTGFLSGHIKMRPDCTEETVHTSMDLDRLSEEVYAFSNKIPDAAILYSNASLVYSDSYMESLYDYYSSLVYSGKTVQFITDRHPEKMHSSDILLIPEAKNVTAQTLAEIKKFADSGKKIIMIGSDCLKYNEYNQANDSSDVTYVTNKSKVFTKKTFGSYEWGATIEDIKKEATSDNEYKLVSSSSGSSLVTDLEYQIAVVDGRVLMNVYYIANEDENSKTFYIRRDNSTLQSVKNLLTGEQFGSKITIKTREPMLLEIGTTSANDVINLSVDENNRISWDYKADNERKAKIYKVMTDGSLDWITDVNGNYYEASCTAPETYMIIAQNNTGALSEGKVVTVGTEAGFSLINNEKTSINQNTGKCVVYIENSFDNPIAEKISVVAKDKDSGEIKKMAIFEKLLLPGTAEEFTCNVLAVDSIIEIVEN